MAFDLSDRLMIAVSADALFDLNTEHKIYRKYGEAAFRAYQLIKEEEVLRPGKAFTLVSKLLHLKHLNHTQKEAEDVEVILLSRDSADASLRIFHSMEYYGMDIVRAVFIGDSEIVPYLQAFQTDLFLSADVKDVQSALEAGIAAGAVCGSSAVKTAENTAAEKEDKASLRIAFDGDAVLFTDESEQIFKEKGLCAFEENETKKARIPLAEGPFAALLKKLSRRKNQTGQEQYIRLALVTSRCAPAHERVIRTLREWNTELDEIFFLGGISKREILKAYCADIFFDDQQIHIYPASEVVTAALVPYRNRRSEKAEKEKKEKTGRKHEIRQYSGRNLPGKTEPVYGLRGSARQNGDGPCEKYRQVSGTFTGRGKSLSAGER